MRRRISKIAEQKKHSITGAIRPEKPLAKFSNTPLQHIDKSEYIAIKRLSQQYLTNLKAEKASDIAKFSINDLNKLLEICIDIEKKRGSANITNEELEFAKIAAKTIARIRVLQQVTSNNTNRKEEKEQEENINFKFQEEFGRYFENNSSKYLFSDLTEEEIDELKKYVNENISHYFDFTKLNPHMIKEIFQRVQYNIKTQDNKTTHKKILKLLAKNSYQKYDYIDLNFLAYQSEAFIYDEFEINKIFTQFLPDELNKLPEKFKNKNLTFTDLKNIFKHIADNLNTELFEIICSKIDDEILRTNMILRTAKHISSNTFGFALHIEDKIKIKNFAYIYNKYSSYIKINEEFIETSKNIITMQRKHYYRFHNIIMNEFPYLWTPDNFELIGKDQEKKDKLIVKKTFNDSLLTDLEFSLQEQYLIKEYAKKYCNIIKPFNIKRLNILAKQTILNITNHIDPDSSKIYQILYARLSNQYSIRVNTANDGLLYTEKGWVFINKYVKRNYAKHFKDHASTNLIFSQLSDDEKIQLIKLIGYDNKKYSIDKVNQLKDNNLRTVNYNNLIKILEKSAKELNYEIYKILCKEKHLYQIESLYIMLIPIIYIIKNNDLYNCKKEEFNKILQYTDIIDSIATGKIAKIPNFKFLLNSIRNYKNLTPEYKEELNKIFETKYDLEQLNELMNFINTKIKIQIIDEEKAHKENNTNYLFANLSRYNQILIENYIKEENLNIKKFNSLLILLAKKLNSKIYSILFTDQTVTDKEDIDKMLFTINKIIEDNNITNCKNEEFNKILEFAKVVNNININNIPNLVSLFKLARNYINLTKEELEEFNKIVDTKYHIDLLDNLISKINEQVLKYKIEQEHNKESKNIFDLDLLTGTMNSKNHQAPEISQDNQDQNKDLLDIFQQCFIEESQEKKNKPYWKYRIENQQASKNHQRQI